MTKELGQLHNVALKQPARLGAETEEPFKTGRAHPPRGLAKIAGVKVECGAHAEQQRSMQAAPVVGHPYLLLRCAQSDPDHVCLAVVDEPHVFGNLAFREWTVRRRTGTDNAKARKLLLQARRKCFGHTGGSAIEEVPVSASGRAPA